MLMSFNSVLNIPKTQGNFNCAGSFATILLSSLQEKNIKLVSLVKKGKFEDTLTVEKNGKQKSLIIGGNDSVYKIYKRLGKNFQ